MPKTAICAECGHAWSMPTAHLCYNKACVNYMVPAPGSTGLVVPANQGWASLVVEAANDLPPPVKTLGVNTCFNIARYLELYRQLTQSRAEDDELKILINLLTLTKAGG